MSQYDYLIQSNYSIENIGGIEKVVRQMTEVLSNKKVCVFFGGSTSKITVQGNITLACARILFSVKGLNFLLWGNLRFFLIGKKSRVIIINEPYPSLWPAILALKAISRDIRIFHHATPHIPSPMRALFFAARKQVYKGLPIATTSPQLAQSLGKNNSQIVPLTISEERFSVAPKFSIPKRFVLYIGRLGTYKGIDILVETIKLCPNVNFVIVGKGPKAELLNTQFLKENNNVTFVNDFVAEEEKNFLLESCELLIFPSTNSGEAFGIIQLEAMYYGTPIINTFLHTGVNFVGVHEINALTIQKNDSAQLAAGVNKLWNDRDYLSELSKGAFQRYWSVFSRKKNEQKLSYFLLDETNFDYD